MISFRQHLVTLVAVFLALSVGIVLGGGPLSDVGRGALTSAPTQPDQNRQVDQAAAFGDAFATASATRLYGEGLSGRPVVVVTLPGADERTVKGLTAQIEQAAGSVDATWALEPALVEVGEKSLVDTLGSQLMTQLGGSVADEGAPTYERMGQLIGRAVATKDPAGAASDDTANAIRESLSGAELAVGQDPEARRAPLVLVVLGDDTNDDVLGGLVTGLAAAAVGVVVVGDTESGINGDVSGLRARPTAADAATVDGAEHALGQVAAVLTLIRSLRTTGGSFGASGADGAAPLG